MNEPHSARAQAFENLTREFPDVPVRVVITIFLRYLEHGHTLARAVEATRYRIRDACAVPA